MATAVFVVFALLAAALAYLALRGPLGRVVAAGSALAVLLLFAALFWWIGSLLREGGVAP
ncbi:MAG TPA: hypothetical protein VGC93_11520 [Thermoanaerobaculia bacterium]